MRHNFKHGNREDFMFTKIARLWWGDFKEGELKKFGLLSLIFGLVIGSYWFLRPLKDSVFMNVVGANEIPNAKILSLFIVFPLVLLYTKLVDLFPREKLFYALCTIYGLIGLIFAFLIGSPQWGMSAGIASPDRWWGWAWYVYVESYGSLIVALFWAFTGDTTLPEAAQRGYPVIAFGGQLGNIFGPLLLKLIMENLVHIEISPEGELSAEGARSSALALAGSVVFVVSMIFLIIALIRYFVAAIPKEQLVGYHGKNEKHDEEPGFFEGLKLIFSSSYLLGIFAIITAFETIITVLDFNFKSLVSTVYPNSYQSTIYLANFGIWVGVISMLSITLKINNIQKYLGVGPALASLPILVAGAVLTFKAYPVLNVVFCIMVLSKAVNYALNQPTMKQLYIPTSKDAKYKSQAFIEMYGSRGSKALGSAVNVWRKTFMTQYGAIAGLNKFINMCTVASLAIIGVWFPITLFLGRTFNKAVDENRIVV